MRSISDKRRNRLGWVDRAPGERGLFEILSAQVSGILGPTAHLALGAIVTELNEQVTHQASTGG